MVMREHAGFTLVELMITLVILALLLVVAIPLTRAWVANAHIARAEDQLRGAYARARGLALRNPSGVTATASAVLLTVSGTSMTLQQGNGGATAWSGSADSDTTVALTSTGCANQLALDNNGLALNSACLAYSISAAGGSSASGTLY